MAQHAHLRVLLLQVREEAQVRKEEHETFAKYSGLAEQQIEVLNAFDTPDFAPRVVDGYDALLVGGASEASVLESEKYAFLQPAKSLLQYCVDKQIPVFASCFGFQLAVVAFGGAVIRDETDFEMGTIPISLTEAAVDDPLFNDTPDGFVAVSGHKERALTPPDGCEMLAYTDACCHAFRVTGKPFWGFQFHPEVDVEILAERLTIFRQHYLESEEHLQRVLNSLSQTPESNKLLKKFVDRVLLPT
ncbi:type 1 glutamine amidotransferase [bacterium]|nr:type 1 glutamine amidotransferase [bacterium]